MGTVQELQLEIRGPPESLESPRDGSNADHWPPSSSNSKRRALWLKAVLYSFLIIVGQTVGTLLGRFYYNQGGNSKWLTSLMGTVGFPVAFIVLLFPFPADACVESVPEPTTRKLLPIYIALGLIVAGDNLMYSYGLLYLPVSTFSLICATQLAFNAVFSYFLNAQKLTPHILNAVVLLTFSAAILGVKPDSSGAAGVSKGMYPIGFMLTLVASATFSLILSLTQLTFQKVIKRETLPAVIKMLIWTGFVATVAAIVGLFASGEWRGLKAEMDGFKKGRVAYVMTLVWMALCWQVYGVGALCLTFAVSSLFCNMVCTFALPLVPIFAVVLFGDRMDGLKVIAILIAIWGFCSYIYQDYLDYLKARSERKTEELCSESQS